MKKSTKNWKVSGGNVKSRVRRAVDKPATVPAMAAPVLAGSMIKLPTFTCTRCGHSWHPKKEEKPRCCGFCKSSYWDKPVDKESHVKARHVKECEACKALLVDVAS